jgi:hypothetical protein
MLPALIMTGASFAAVAFSMRALHPSITAVLPSHATSVEQIVLLAVPSVAATVDGSRAVDRIAPPPAMRDEKRTEFPSPPDTSAGPSTSDEVTPANAPASLSPAPLPSRLLRPAAPGVPWYSPPRPHNPFERGEPLSTAERDSLIGEAMARMAATGFHYEPTQSERDAMAKEAMLKMRNTGRILLVPPDNSGGLITMPLPFFSRGPSKARRVRESQAFDENRARLERLRQRADSARRARGDTLPLR